MCKECVQVYGVVVDRRDGGRVVSSGSFSLCACDMRDAIVKRMGRELKRDIRRGRSIRSKVKEVCK
jgi:hypothetical protein